MNKNISVIVTCEHGGNSVPKRFDNYFRGCAKLLKSHAGYDIGSWDLSRKLSRSMSAPLYAYRMTRLLIDLNRSLRSPFLYSNITAALSVPEKGLIMRKYYRPHRAVVESAVLQRIGSGLQVLHLAVHTFTPVFHGTVRRADIGLLYDPSRAEETEFCLMVKREILRRNPRLRVRRNYPYRGLTEGLCTSFRDFLSQDDYLGIELEVNQKHALGERRSWRSLQETIAGAVKSVFGETRH